ncbi:MAG: tRNA (N(6)-L-threonylcarbamoyladenosine(37)-C(2))-methylthiotransferase MtaB [Candidatus Acidiferrales bacterium]
MPTFSIENFGCRATFADTAAIERQLLDRGLVRTGEHRDAEIVVLNTCTVTAAADAQARDAIRHIHAANRGARIVVTGCYAQRAPDELAQLEGVAWVVGNSHQSEIPNLAASNVFDAAPSASPSDFVPAAFLFDAGMSLARGPAKILTGDIFAQTTVLLASVEGGEAERTRPTLKIQDGCNNRCSYCVIPFVRGNSRSLEPNHVVSEIARLVAAGIREVVLSGINLGSYGRDFTPRVPLDLVLRRVLAETPLESLRLSSIEPMDVTRDFVELLASHPRIAPHFHMPLQSASNPILRAMHRWYRAEHYERRVEVIREFLPHAAIGADVIAGFPGESEDDFRATFEFIDRLPFTYLHVFSFSPRPGTAAAHLLNELPPDVIHERARRLRELGARKAAAFRVAQAGRTLRALTLKPKKAGVTEILTGNFLKLRVAGTWPANLWLDVRVEADGCAGLVGSSDLIASATNAIGIAAEPAAAAAGENAIAAN